MDEELTEEQRNLMVYKKQQERIRKHLEETRLYRLGHPKRVIDRIYRVIDIMDSKGSLSEGAMLRADNLIKKWEDTS